MDQTTLSEHRDIIKMTFIGYICHLGSALNLWSGITVVVAVELVELLYEAIIGKCCQTKNNTVSADELQGIKEQQNGIGVSTSKTDQKDIKLWIMSSQMNYCFQEERTTKRT